MNDHQTSAYGAAGHATGSAPPSLAAGDGSTTHLADPSTRHRCITTSRLSPKRVGSRSAIPTALWTFIIPMARRSISKPMAARGNPYGERSMQPEPEHNARVGIC
jgi:hypothetical protein